MISPKKVKKKKKKHWYTENWKTLEGGENGKLMWWADFRHVKFENKKNGYVFMADFFTSH